MISVLGLDIGGANIKTVFLTEKNGEPLYFSGKTRYFEMWHTPGGLASVLASLAAGWEVPAAVAAVTTAELADAFPTKKDGVRSVASALACAFPRCPVYLLDRWASWRPLHEVRSAPLDFAATNWLATSLRLGTELPTALLIDTGSTTTDIIPIRDGKPSPSGTDDTSRLQSGELVYTGVVRTNPNTLAGAVPLEGRRTRVAAEYFTIMADVYRLTGLLSEDEYTCPTPDGRGRDLPDCAARLARLVCADTERISFAAIGSLARYLSSLQTRLITDAILEVLKEQRFALPPAAVPLGLGRTVAARAAQAAGLPVWEKAAGYTAFPNAEAAEAAAWLLARHIEGLKE